MPKEIVVGSFDGPDTKELLVQVGWSEETVQVATLARDTETHETDPHEGWFVDLDRRGINALIRNLRRARDQAFGRDE